MRRGENDEEGWGRSIGKNRIMYGLKQIIWMIKEAAAL